MSVTSITPITISCNVDLANNTNYVFEAVPQGDGRSRFIEVTLYNNGVPYEVPTTAKAAIEGRNAGGYNIDNECSISSDGTKITIPLSGGILTCAGVGKYHLAVYADGSCIISFGIVISVIENYLDMEKLEASDSYELLTNMIKEAQEFNKWIVDSGVPSSTVGNEGDFYLNVDNGDIYHKEKDSSGKITWSSSPVGNIKEKVYVAYSDSSTDIYYSPKSTTQFIGICTTTSNTQPTTRSSYVWSRIRSGIVNTTIDYTVSNTYDPLNPPTTGWGSLPTLIPGQFLWTRRTIKTNDGDTTSVEYEYSVTRDGISCQSVEVMYVQGDDEINHPADTASWKTTIPTIAEGKFLWGRMRIYTDKNGTSTELYKTYYPITKKYDVDPMVFRGSLGTGGTITSLPTASTSNRGYTYKVITAGTYASQVAKVGDTFISDGSTWVLIPSGDEPSGTVTSIATGTGLTGGTITTSGTISLNSEVIDKLSAFESIGLAVVNGKLCQIYNYNS